MISFDLNMSLALTTTRMGRPPDWNGWDGERRGARSAAPSICFNDRDRVDVPALFLLPTLLPQDRDVTSRCETIALPLQITTLLPEKRKPIGDDVPSRSFS